jgi:ABC-type sulfate/molybdate transport systems ATPase subunit
MITHNPEAASIASRILYMRDGEIVREERGSRADTVLAAPGAAKAAAGDEMQTLNLVASPVETIQDGRS